MVPTRSCLAIGAVDRVLQRKVKTELRIVYLSGGHTSEFVVRTQTSPLALAILERLEVWPGAHHPKVLATLEEFTWPKAGSCEISTSFGSSANCSGGLVPNAAEEVVEMTGA